MPMNTDDLLRVALYTLIHRAGGEIAISRAEYELATALPCLVEFDHKPGHIILRLRAQSPDQIICLDRGDGHAVCGKPSDVVISHDFDNVDCPNCIAMCVRRIGKS